MSFLLLLGLALGCEGPPQRPRQWSDSPVVPDRADPKGPSTEQQLSRERHRLRDQSLRIHMNADPGSLNPLEDPSAWSLRITMDNVFETLIRYRPQGSSGQGSYQAGLATRWTVAPGGREIRISLNEGAHWQDGKAVTALDVQFSLEAAASRRVHADHHRQALADLSAVEIIGRSELRLRLARPNAFVLRQLATVPILPEHIYLRRLTQSAGDWIGSGPYRVAHEADDGVILERDPNYWGQAPNVLRVEFVREQDAAVALRDAKEGQIDIVPELIASHYPEQLEAPGLDQKFRLLELAPPTLSYVVLNTGRPPFEDSGVRRAIAQLIDDDALLDAAGGLARPVSGPIWPLGPGNGPALDVFAFSSAQAEALLDLAGWRDDDGDGVRARAGQRLMISVLATEGENAGRDLVMSALRKAGFVLDVRVGNPAVLENRLRDGEFDLAFATWTGDFDRDLAPLLSTGGALNYGAFHSPVVDEILEEIRNAWEPEQRVPILGRLAQALRGGAPLIALPAPFPRGLVHRRVSGLVVWNAWFSVRDLKLSNEER